MRMRGARRSWEGRFAALLLVGGLLGGCGLGGGPPEPPGHASSEAIDVAEVSAVLQARSRAVRHGNVDAFLEGVASDPGLRHTQRVWFENLRQLPIQRFAHSLDADDVTRTATGVTAALDVVLRLDGFDTAPVHTPTVYDFVREQDGALRISAVRPPPDGTPSGTPQPWDLAPVEILHGDGVLGVFDRDSSMTGRQIITEVERAIDQVSAVVPLEWSHTVVVYALSNTDFLRALDDLPGGDPEQLDGVAFPVPVRPGATRYAGTRFLLHPRILERTPDSRSRLIRHELVHVALGQRDDRVPTWLSEGLAEYVSVRPLAPQERLISRQTVRAAEEGLARLPSDATFNGADSSANYGIAWYACEYIAAAYGEQTLWRLLDEMGADGGTSSDTQDVVLQRMLGISSRTLAEATGRRVLATFGS